MCGVALLDVWGETLCHACHKRSDPKWKEARVFAKPVVVYARKTSKEEERRSHSHSSTSPPPTIGAASEHGSVSKGSDALALRSSSKTSLALQDDAMGRSSTKRSSVSHTGSDMNGQRPVSKGHDGHHHHHGEHHHHHHHQHATGNAGFSDEAAGGEVKKEEAHAAAQPAPPPFSEIQGSVHVPRQPSKKGHHHGHHEGHHEGGHHHHHHHHHEHHESASDTRKHKRADKQESLEQLAKLTDHAGHQLTVGDRVIGEGKIGDDMGLGTITGANTSHGHGMVIVQYDSGGHAHPMKAEHLKKLEAKDEADVVKRLEKAKKEKAKHHGH